MPHDISFFLQHNKIDNKQAIHRIIIEDSLQQAAGNALDSAVQSLFGKNYQYEKTFVSIIKASYVTWTGFISPIVSLKDLYEYVK